MSHRLWAAARAPWVVAYAVLALFTVASVGGYWNFALHPQRLPTSPGALWFFSISFRFFAQLHIALAAVALAVVLVRTLGWRWWPALLGVYAVSFLSEHVGTGYGVPFGGYAYTSLLGAKLGGRVPALIPLSWFLMALPAWVFARAATSRRGGLLPRLGLGALWLTVWDLALDPAMSHLTTYWRWEDSGPYYGMPWINLLGWYVTGLALMGVLEAVSDRVALERLPIAPMAWYYGLVMALPLGMLLAAGAFLAVAVSLGGILAAGTLSVVVARRQGALAPSRGDEPTPVGAR